MAFAVHIEIGGDPAPLAHEHPNFPFERDGLRFSIDDADEADWLVQPFYVSWPVETRVPLERRILLITEPRARLSAAYLNQFGVLVSPYNLPGFAGSWYRSHAALSALFGLEPSGEAWRANLDYTALMTLPVPEKRDAISVVTSRKSILPGHRRRLRFLRHLAGVLGPRLEIHGEGFRRIADKADAILPCRYHLVLENTIMRSYWTEKLTDAWLGYAFPIVSGPPDLARWFPRESFVSIDIDDPAPAAKIVLATMKEGVSPERFAAILEARRRVMTEERLCPLIARVIAARPSSASRLAAIETIHPPAKPATWTRVSRELSRVIWQADTWFRGRPGD